MGNPQSGQNVSKKEKRMSRKRPSFRIVASLLFACLVLTVQIGAHSRAEASVTATLPADFSDALVTSVASPTALAFTPDGRMLITTQPGRLRVYQNNALLANP